MNKKALPRILATVLLCCAWFATPDLVLAQAKPANAVATLRLGHTLDDDRHLALTDIVTRFNAQRNDVRIDLVRGGLEGVPDAQMFVLGSAEGEVLSAGKPRFKPLHAMMKEAGVPLRTARPPAVLGGVLVDQQGRLNALPVGFSTPVLFLNRDVFIAAGLDPDAPLTTWGALQQTLGVLSEAGVGCPYTVTEPARIMIENTSAWHNEPLLSVVGKTQQFSFNGMLNIKHVAMMASWHRARYLRVFGSPGEAEQRFAEGECAVIAAASSSWSVFRKEAAFSVGVMSFPYHDDIGAAPQNTLADGSALWVMAGRKKAEYKLIAAFVDFWLQPENQVAWELNTGYLPLNRAGFLAAQSDLLGADLKNVRVAVGQLLNKPPTSASSAVRVPGRDRMLRIVDAALEDVWAERKPVKQALDDAMLLVQSPAAAKPATR